MSTTAVQILLVEDNIADAVLMKQDLAESPFGPFAVTHVKRLSEAVSRIAAGHIDAVMLDLGLPDSQGISTLREIQKHAPRDIPIVVLTGLHDDALAVKALGEGAADYLTKGVAAESMPARAVRYAIERKRADEAFLVSEQRLAMAVDAAKIGIFDWNLQTGEVIQIHDSKHLFGLAPHEMSPTFEGFGKCVHPDDQAALETMIQRAISQNEELLHECRTVWPDGSQHWIETRARVFYDDHDKPLRMLGTVMDISKRKADQTAARMRDAELAHLSRVTTMGQMASGLAHELNQPLAAILNYATICRQFFESNEGSRATAKTAADELLDETRRAGAIISRMRSFVRKQQPAKHALDLNTLILESINLMQFELQHQRIRPILQLDEKLPKVMCDSIQIEQVLVNLIFNALEAMENTRTDQKKLALGSSMHNRTSVDVAVIDSGSGMSAEASERMFEPFFTTKARGLGMGLNISRSIIESHGGRISASPNPTGGMRFCFTLPVSNEEV